MKKILIMLIAVLVTSITNSFAKNSHNISLVSVKNTDEINLKLDLGNVTNLSEKEIKSKIYTFLDKNIPLNSELKCSLTLKASTDVGGDEVGIEIKVSGPCSEMATKGKKIANNFMNEVKKEVKEAFD